MMKIIVGLTPQGESIEGNEIRLQLVVLEERDLESLKDSLGEAEAIGELSVNGKRYRLGGHSGCPALTVERDGKVETWNRYGRATEGNPVSGWFKLPNPAE